MGSKLLRTVLVAALTLGVAAAVPAADAPQPLVFAGRVEAAEQTGISARVAGAVARVNVDIGDRVKKGQVLIELDAPELRDDLDAAAAKLDQAKAQVEQAEAATAAAKARVAQADAGRDTAEDAYKSALASPTATPASVLTETKGRLDTGQAARAAAAAEVAQAQAGVKVAQAGVEIAAVGVRKAQTRLGFTRIVAPFDGVVTRRLVDTGAVVGPPKPGETAPLLSVMRDDVVRVVFDVDERSALRLAVGAPVVITASAAGGAVFKGKVAHGRGLS